MPIRATTLALPQRLFFRDELRTARAAALRDAEQFDAVVRVVERLGSMLNPTGRGLADYGPSLLALIPPEHDSGSPGSSRPPALFEALREGRNGAIHEGAFARHLTRHCIEFALLLEEALMADGRRVSDFMVRDPVCAEPWQTVESVRQRMLEGAFSYVPIGIRETWHLLSDHSVAFFLARAKAESSQTAFKLRRLPVEDAVNQGLELEPALSVEPASLVFDALATSRGKPVLVLEEGRLIGIATPFDFL